jgi:DNA-binding transcriptional regulator of glucitol operon
MAEDAKDNKKKKGMTAGRAIAIILVVIGMLMTLLFGIMITSALNDALPNMENVGYLFLAFLGVVIAQVGAILGLMTRRVH